MFNLEHEKTDKKDKMVVFYNALVNLLFFAAVIKLEAAPQGQGHELETDTKNILDFDLLTNLFGGSSTSDQIESTTSRSFGDLLGEATNLATNMATNMATNLANSDISKNMLATTQNFTQNLLDQSKNQISNFTKNVINETSHNLLDMKDDTIGFLDQKKDDIKNGIVEGAKDVADGMLVSAGEMLSSAGESLVNGTNGENFGTTLLDDYTGSGSGRCGLKTISFFIIFQMIFTTT